MRLEKFVNDVWGNSPSEAENKMKVFVKEQYPGYNINSIEVIHHSHLDMMAYEAKANISYFDEKVKMKQWTISIEETQKLLNEEYTDDTYFIVPKGNETFEIFVNELIGEEPSVCSKGVLNAFKIDRYKIYLYTTAKGKEYDTQIKSIMSAICFTSKFEDAWTVTDLETGETKLLEF